MTKFSLLFALLIVVAGCQQKAATPVDDGTLPGRFRLEVDPLRCSLPTTQHLTIQSTGTDRYRLDYDRFGLGLYHRTDVKATRSSTTKYDLTLDGQPIGQYAFDEILTLNGKQQKWVLLVSHEAGKADGLEFMGVKE